MEREREREREREFGGWGKIKKNPARQHRYLG